jgi:hypothetical protein
MFMELKEKNEQLQAAILQLQGGGGGSIKALPPQAFDGKPGTLQAFLTQLRMYQKANNSQFKYWGERVANAASYLRGDALIWFEPYMREYASKDKDDISDEVQTVLGSINEFEKALRAAFGDVDEQRSTERKILHLKQTGSASKYAAEFRQLASRLPDWSETAFMARFYEGLKDSVKDDLIREERPDRLVDYVALAVKIDDRQYERRAEKGNRGQTGRGWGVRPTFQPNTGRRYQHQPHHRNERRMTTAHGGTTHAGPMELDVLQKGRKDKKDIECFNCHKMGHFARDCRQPKRIEGPRQLNATRHEKPQTAVRTLAVLGRSSMSTQERVVRWNHQVETIDPSEEEESETTQEPETSEDEGSIPDAQPQDHQLTIRLEGYGDLEENEAVDFFGYSARDASKAPYMTHAFGPRGDDDDRLPPGSPDHGTMFWAQCIYDDCPTHHVQKLSHNFYPRRPNDDTIECVYTNEELPHWVPTVRLPGKRTIVFAPSPDYPMPCLSRETLWFDCPIDACRVHASRKIREWRILWSQPGTAKNLGQTLTRIDPNNQGDHELRRQRAERTLRKNEEQQYLNSPMTPESTIIRRDSITSLPTSGHWAQGTGMATSDEVRRRKTGSSSSSSQRPKTRREHHDDSGKESRRSHKGKSRRE